MPRHSAVHVVFFAALALTLPTAVAAQTPQAPAPKPFAGSATEQATKADAAQRVSPWLALPVVSSSPKLGTAVGALGAYLHTFDPGSRVSLFALSYQYTSTHSSIAAAVARTSFGADHHRLIGIGAFGYIKNDYDDYLGTGQPLKTDDDLRAIAARYLYRVKGDWFIGGQASATNYQVFGQTVEDDLVLETLGVQGFESIALGAVAMHDSRDNQDMPTRGWYLNANNLAYLEALGGSAEFDAYRAEWRGFWAHAGGHVLALRQNNWLTNDAPSAAQATVNLRGYKTGQYLAPYMSSFEVEERLAFGTRWGANFFGGVAGLYGQGNAISAERDLYPMWGLGLQFILKPEARMLMNLEYADGIDDNRGVYLKLGYTW